MVLASKKGVSGREGGCRLERGEVVRLIGDTREDPEYFLTYVVWKENGSKKQFPVDDKDGPIWPSPETAKKRFRLGIRAVDVKRRSETVEVSFKEDVKDGINVRKTYKMVKMEQVQAYDFQVKYQILTRVD